MESQDGYEELFSPGTSSSSAGSNLLQYLHQSSVLSDSHKVSNNENIDLATGGPWRAVCVTCLAIPFDKIYKLQQPHYDLLRSQGMQVNKRDMICLRCVTTMEEFLRFIKQAKIWHKTLLKVQNEQNFRNSSDTNPENENSSLLQAHNDPNTVKTQETGFEILPTQVSTNAQALLETCQSIGDINFDMKKQHGKQLNKTIELNHNLTDPNVISHTESPNVDNITTSPEPTMLKGQDNTLGHTNDETCENEKIKIKIKIRIKEKIEKEKKVELEKTKKDENDKSSIHEDVSKNDMEIQNFDNETSSNAKCDDESSSFPELDEHLESTEDNAMSSDSDIKNTDNKTLSPVEKINNEIISIIEKNENAITMQNKATATEQDEITPETSKINFQAKNTNNQIIQNKEIDKAYSSAQSVSKIRMKSKGEGNETIVELNKRNSNTQAKSQQTKISYIRILPKTEINKSKKSQYILNKSQYLCDVQRNTINKTSLVNQKKHYESITPNTVVSDCFNIDYTVIPDLINKSNLVIEAPNTVDNTKPSINKNAHKRMQVIQKIVKLNQAKTQAKILELPSKTEDIGVLNNDKDGNDNENSNYTKPQKIVIHFKQKSSAEQTAISTVEQHIDISANDKTSIKKLNEISETQECTASKDVKSLLQQIDKVPQTEPLGPKSADSIIVNDKVTEVNTKDCINNNSQQNQVIIIQHNTKINDSEKRNTRELKQINNKIRVYKFVRVNKHNQLIVNKVVSGDNIVNSSNDKIMTNKLRKIKADIIKKHAEKMKVSKLKANCVKTTRLSDVILNNINRNHNKSNMEKIGVSPGYYYEVSTNKCGQRITNNYSISHAHNLAKKSHNIDVSAQNNKDENIKVSGNYLNTPIKYINTIGRKNANSKNIKNTQGAKIILHQGSDNIADNVQNIHVPNIIKMNDISKLDKAENYYQNIIYVPNTSKSVNHNVLFYRKDNLTETKNKEDPTSSTDDLICREEFTMTGNYENTDVAEYNNVNDSLSQVDNWIESNEIIISNDDSMNEEEINPVNDLNEVSNIQTDQSLNDNWMRKLVDKYANYKPNNSIPERNLDDNDLNTRVFNNNGTMAEGNFLINIKIERDDTDSGDAEDFTEWTTVRPKIGKLEQENSNPTPTTAFDDNSRTMSVDLDHFQSFYERNYSHQIDHDYDIMLNRYSDSDEDHLSLRYESDDESETLGIGTHKNNSENSRATLANTKEKYGKLKIREHDIEENNEMMMNNENNCDENAVETDELLNPNQDLLKELYFEYVVTDEELLLKNRQTSTQTIQCNKQPNIKKTMKSVSPNRNKKRFNPDFSSNINETNENIAIDTKLSLHPIVLLQRIDQAIRTNDIMQQNFEIDNATSISTPDVQSNLSNIIISEVKTLNMTELKDTDTQRKTLKVPKTRPKSTNEVRKVPSGTFKVNTKTKNPRRTKTYSKISKAKLKSSKEIKTAVTISTPPKVIKTYSRIAKKGANSAVSFNTSKPTAAVTDSPNMTTQMTTAKVASQPITLTTEVTAYQLKTLEATINTPETDTPSITLGTTVSSNPFKVIPTTSKTTSTLTTDVTTEMTNPKVAKTPITEVTVSSKLSEAISISKVTKNYSKTPTEAKSTTDFTTVLFKTPEPTISTSNNPSKTLTAPEATILSETLTPLKTLDNTTCLSNTLEVTTTSKTAKVSKIPTTNEESAPSITSEVIETKLAKETILLSKTDKVEIQPEIPEGRITPIELEMMKTKSKSTSKETTTSKTAKLTKTPTTNEESAPSITSEVIETKLAKKTILLSKTDKVEIQPEIPEGRIIPTELTTTSKTPAVTEVSIPTSEVIETKPAKETILLSKTDKVEIQPEIPEGRITPIELEMMKTKSKSTSKETTTSKTAKLTKTPTTNEESAPSITSEVIETKLAKKTILLSKTDKVEIQPEIPEGRIIPTELTTTSKTPAVTEVSIPTSEVIETKPAKETILLSKTDKVEIQPEIPQRRITPTELEMIKTKYKSTSKVTTTSKTAKLTKKTSATTEVSTPSITSEVIQTIPAKETILLSKTDKVEIPTEIPDGRITSKELERIKTKSKSTSKVTTTSKTAKLTKTPATTEVSTPSITSEVIETKPDKETILQSKTDKLEIQPEIPEGRITPTELERIKTKSKSTKVTTTSKTAKLTKTPTTNEESAPSITSEVIETKPDKETILLSKTDKVEIPTEIPEGRITPKELERLKTKSKSTSKVTTTSKTAKLTKTPATTEVSTPSITSEVIQTIPAKETILLSKSDKIEIQPEIPEGRITPTELERIKTKSKSRKKRLKSPESTVSSKLLPYKIPKLTNISSKIAEIATSSITTNSSTTAFKMTTAPIKMRLKVPKPGTKLPEETNSLTISEVSTSEILEQEVKYPLKNLQIKLTKIPFTTGVTLTTTSSSKKATNTSTTQPKTTVQSTTYKNRKRTPKSKVKQFRRSNSYKYTVIFLKVDDNILEIMDEIRSQPEFQNAPFKCHQCACPYYKISPYLTHQEMYHSEKSGDFECPICKCRYKTKKDLKSHTREHKRYYQCKICPQISLMRINAKKHHKRFHYIHKKKKKEKQVTNESG